VDTVLVLADGGRPALALLTLARRIGTPVAVTMGEADREMLARFGARAIWTVESSDVDTCPATVRVEALTRLAAEIGPSCLLAILVAEGRSGQEIAGRVAVRLGSGVLTGAVDLWMGPDGPIVTQRVLDGAYLAESEVVRGVTVCSVRTCEVEPVEVADGAPVRPTVHGLHLGLLRGWRSAQLVRGKKESQDLENAAIVVAGGHGLGSSDGFALAGRLAQALGGAACGSFTATELGWCPPRQRVDQIGTTVHPQLYLALGVSGSIRHRAGMQTAQTIIAVDRDPEAPIFGVADLGVVGDARDVARELLKEIERRRL